MSESNERLEQLISRKLDGELLGDESLELDKCLIRDPAASKCLEDSQKIDALTATFLDEVCAEFDENDSGVQVTAAQPRRRWPRSISHDCRSRSKAWSRGSAKGVSWRRPRTSSPLACRVAGRATWFVRSVTSSLIVATGFFSYPPRPATAGRQARPGARSRHAEAR